MLAGIKKYMGSCPLLKGGTVKIDALGEDPAQFSMKYSIETAVCSPVIKQYADGGSQRQYLFIFSSREQMDEHGLANLQNSEFYEKLTEWIDEQNAAGVFPELGPGRQAQRVEVLTPGYLDDVSKGGTTGKYQIQLRVIYYRAA